MKVKLKGTKNVEKQIKKAMKKFEHRQIRPIFEKEAETLKNQVKSNTPVGETRNLRDSIRTLEMPQDPIVYLVAVDRNKAPHAHLVEFGTADREQQTGKSVGSMPANPFFRPAWDSLKPRINANIQKELAKLIRN